MSTTSPIDPTAPITTAPVPTDEELELQRDAFEKIKDEIVAVPEDQFETINVEIPAVVIVVLGHIEHIHAFRQQLIDALTGFPVDTFDKLETYTLATNHAHTHYLAASVPGEPIGPLVDELSKTREQLNPDVGALARRGFVDGERLKNLQGTNGFKNIANDVLLLAMLLRERWDTVGSKTAIPLDEIIRAEKTANRLIKALAKRDAGAAAASAAAATRQAAFTLFVNAYDDVRRGLTYLRWKQDDVESIAPSLYAGRGGRKKADPEETAPVPTAPVTPAPVVASPTAPVVTTNGSNGSSNGGMEITPGLPGHSPFTR